jgi:type I restriction enzyme, S subunit
MTINNTEIPKGWKQKQLRDLIEIRSGISPSKFNFVKEGKYPFFKVNDMNFCNKYLNNAALYFNVYDFPLMKSGMVVFPKRGAAIFTNKIAILERDGFFDTNIMGLTTKSKVLNEFLYYYLSYLKLYEIADTSSVPQINNKHIEPLNINLPPAIEQKKIASILSTIDNLIENTTNLINSYSLLKKGLMQTLLTKGIGHTKFKKTEIGEIPEEWELISLEKLGSTYNGLTGKNKEHFGKGKPYIPYKNIFNNTKIDINYLGYVTIEENEKQNKVKYGDVLFTTSSETAEEVGYSSVLLDNLKETYLNSFCFGYRLNNFNKIKPEFLRYLLRGQAIRKLIIKIAQGYTRFNLSKVQVLKIRIPVPPVVEQLKISKILSKLDEYLSIYIAKKEELKLLKKGLMQQLLTGRIRVKI